MRRSTVISGVLSLLILATVIEGRGQVLVPLEATGIVGKEVRVVLLVGDTTFSSSDTVRISGRLKIKNPTVYYPQQIVGGVDVEVVDSELPFVVDSLRDFSASLLPRRDLGVGDTLMVILGEAPAGSDTVTALTFQEVRIGPNAQPDLESSVVVSTLGPRLPYVRFGQLDPGRPNPTVPGTTVTWGFRIDRTTPVVFRIYDVVGRMIVEDDLGTLDLGVYTHSITPDVSTPSGFFLVHLSTEIGDDYEVMHVLH